MDAAMLKVRRGVGAVRVVSMLVLLAFLGLGCWLHEVLVVRGWEGLAWLSSFPLAAIPGCLFVVLASLVPVWGLAAVLRWKVGLYGVLAWGVALGSFTIARAAMYSSFGRFGMMLAMHPDTRVSYLLSVFGWLFLALVLTSAGMGLGVRWLGFPVRRRTVLFLALALVAVFPASALTIQVLPALHGQRDFIHAVKMGYPVFWTILLVAGAVALGRQPVRG